MNKLDIIKNFNNKKILVIGDTILDAYVYGKAVSLSLDSPTIEAEETKSQVTFGGNGLVANNMLALGGSVIFFSIIGNDAAAKYYDKFVHPKLTKHFIVDENRQTTIKKRYWIDDYKILQLNQVTNDYINQDIENKILESIKPYFNEVDLVFILDAQHGMLSKNLIDSILKLVKQHNKILYVDSQISHRPSNHIHYYGAGCIFFSLDEAKAVDPDFNLDDAEKSTRKLMKKLNLKNIVIKLGDQGTLSIFNDKFIKSPGHKVQAVDTCGAGDAFLAAFALGNRDYAQESFDIANTWAALSTTIHGTRPPSKQALIDIYSKK